MINQLNGVFPAVCPLDCPDTCGLLLHKEDGKIVKVSGNPAHPITQGAICNKVRHMTERIYHEERVLYPLRRTGTKGEGRFERISWEEAIKEITGRFTQIIQEHGSEAILPYSFYGNMGVLGVDGMDRRFFHAIGASYLEQTICSAAGDAGWKYTMGANRGTVPEETEHADLIVIWGGNIVSTRMHQVVLAEKARKKGAKVIVIDVHRNRTAQWADWFIPLHPGTDAALALGIIHVLFKEGMINESFLTRYTVGHEQLSEHVKEYTTERVSLITGVPQEDILKLARLYGGAKAPYIHIGNGLQHHDNGGMNVRAIACLPALVGAWHTHGGGAAKSNGGYASFNSEALERPDLRPNPEARTINMNQIGAALLEEENKIRAMFVYCSNPLVVAPDTERVEQGFAREDLFTVVHDLFMTDTAKYADIVLPAASSFESTDLYSSYWHQYVQIQEPVIPPQGEAKSNVEVFSLLGQAMGLDEKTFCEDELSMIRGALNNPVNPYLQGVTLEALQEHRFVKLDMTPYDSFLDHLPTPSGKIELYSKAMEQAGLPPMPVYAPLLEGYDGERPAGQGDQYPLMFLSPPNHNFLNSTFANVPKHQKLEKQPVLQIHPRDAENRKITDGEPVIVFNDRGTYELIAKVTESMLPGTVISQGLWWEGEGRKQRANRLTPDRLSDMGNGATFFSATVQVRKKEDVTI
ncbi:molybdopterin-containing oxidoreductase family protein [Paenibacillus gallinarum]|uniref:Molybdopterin oxidoreductase family protein n=1 Tax=Paenibacillus gallinarum TaxID=2762232 RepID=A0ABR8SZV2_9BACL|nr:molybdopterin oxidoreductase family protein [Paenibacillus gallinarum]MBD7969032.1 molybdopterin oxidoreductase family protein [Paenibacillus gallinarum]